MKCWIIYLERSAIQFRFVTLRTALLLAVQRVLALSLSTIRSSGAFIIGIIIICNAWATLLTTNCKRHRNGMSKCLCMTSAFVHNFYVKWRSNPIRPRARPNNRNVCVCWFRCDHATPSIRYRWNSALDSVSPFFISIGFYANEMKSFQ